MINKTAHRYYNKALLEIESHNLGSAIDWLNKAIDKKVEDEYRHILACCLFDTGNEEEAFDIWNELVFTSNYSPSIQTVEYLIYNNAIQKFDERCYSEAEDLLLHIVNEPFELDANTVYLISMSQLKQSKFEVGWDNMELAAEMGHDDAQTLMKKKHSQGINTSEGTSLDNFDYDKLIEKIGKSALTGTIISISGRILSEIFD